MTVSLDSQLEALSDAARKGPSPLVDVVTRVQATLAARTATNPDFVPWVCCGLAVAVAALTVFALLPSWEHVRAPWTAYLQSGW